MIKPFRLTYLVRVGGGGGGGSKSLIIACLTFYLVLANRTILALPEYNSKVVNVYEMHRIGGLEVVVLSAFRQISAMIMWNVLEKVMKSAITFSLDSQMILKAQFRYKVIETTLSYQILFCYSKVS